MPSDLLLAWVLESSIRDMVEGLASLEVPSDNVPSGLEEMWNEYVWEARDFKAITSELPPSIRFPPICWIQEFSPDSFFSFFSLILGFFFWFYIWLYLCPLYWKSVSSHASETDYKKKDYKKQCTPLSCQYTPPLGPSLKLSYASL